MSRIIGHGLGSLLVACAMAMLIEGPVHAVCIGDCNGDGMVSAGELTKLVAIIINCSSAAAGCSAVPGGCVNGDSNGNGKIDAGEITHVVSDKINFASGCPPVSPSPSVAAPTPSNTPAPTQIPTNTAAPTNTPTNTPPAPTNTRANTATATKPAATKTPTPAPACGDGVVQAGEDCDVGGICTGGTNAGTVCKSEATCTGTGVCDSGAHAETVCSTAADCGGAPAKCIHCKTFGGVAIPGDSQQRTCSANCTFETNIPFNLVPGVALKTNPPSVMAGTSGSIVTGGAIKLALALSGSQVISIGKPKNDLVPFVIKAASVHLDKIQVGTIACACVRSIPGKTCGGTLFEANGTASTDCTPQYTVGACSNAGKTCTVDADCPDPFIDSNPSIALSGNTCVSGICTCHNDSDCPTGGTCVVHVCDAIGKPCSFVNGAGNSSSGNIGCTGLDNVDISFTQQSVLMTPAHPQNGLAPPGSGLPVLTFSGQGGPGSALVLNTSAIGTTQGTLSDGVTTIHPTGDFCTGVSTAIPNNPNPGFCDGTVYGHDCHFCVFNGVDDDPQSAHGPVGTLPQTTGTASAEIFGSWSSGKSTCCTDTTGVTCASPPVSCSANSVCTAMAPSFPVCAQDIGPKTATGTPLTNFSCASPFVPPASITGFATAGAFTELNQPSTSDIVVTNVFIAQ